MKGDDVGPYVVGYINKHTGSFRGGMIYLSCSALLAALLILAVHKPPQSAGVEAPLQ